MLNQIRPMSTYFLSCTTILLSLLIILFCSVSPISLSQETIKDNIFIWNYSIKLCSTKLDQCQRTFYLVQPFTLVINNSVLFCVSIIPEPGNIKIFIWNFNFKNLSLASLDPFFLHQRAAGKIFFPNFLQIFSCTQRKKVQVVIVFDFHGILCVQDTQYSDYLY